MILYIHGAFSTPEIFNYIRSQVGGEYHTLHYDAFEPLSETITRLNIEVANKEYKTIIGHSLGGVIGYRLMQKGLKVEKLITISTPFAGATPVSWLVHAARKFRSTVPLASMKPEVIRFIDFVDNIDKYSPEYQLLRKSPVPKAEYYSIITNMGHNFMPEDNDFVVTVKTQKSHPGKAEFHEMWCPHTEVVLRQETSEKIKEWIGR